MCVRVHSIQVLSQYIRIHLYVQSIIPIEYVRMYLYLV